MTRKDPIKKVTLADGKTVRYRFSVRVGQKPRIDKATGRPVLDGRGRPVMMADQRVITCNTRKEAEAERTRLLNDKNKGTVVQATKKTVAEQCDEFLAGHREVKESTLANYRTALIPVRESLGTVALRDLTKPMVDSLVTTMLTSGRRVGTKGKPLSPLTVNLMLTVLRMVLDDAAEQGLVARNVARLVKRARVEADDQDVKTEMSTWTAEQAAAFLQFVAGDRLSVAWQLSLYGLRRGEVLGLRWSDIDLVKGTLTIRKTRTIVRGADGKGRVVEGEPKSVRGRRTLPLDPATVDALTALQLRQREEAETAGSAYGSCPDCGQAHVVADELGEPVHPESYSDRFEVLVKKSGLPPIRLHDLRHTCGTLMHLRGVKTAVISAWLGHASASFTMKTYVHSQDDALVDAGQTLMAAYAPRQDQVAK